jgi:hypothetical protein
MIRGILISVGVVLLALWLVRTAQKKKQEKQNK